VAAPGEAFVLAVDLGTSACKVDLISERGVVIGHEAEIVPVQYFDYGGAEQDLEACWHAFVRCAQRLLGRRLVPVDSIVAVCAATHGFGTVAVDRDGRPLHGALIWLDARGAEYARQLVGGFVAGYAPHHLLRWLRLTGGAPSLSGKDAVGHLLFLREEHPEVYRAAHKFLDVLSYIDFRLTGRMVSTTDNAATTWLADNRDLRSVRYHPGLLARLDLSPERLPPIVGSAEVLGPLIPQLAEELGLPKSVQVVGGSFDLPAAALGAGAARDFEPQLSIATSSFITVHVPFKKTDVLHSMASLPSGRPDRYLLLAEQEIAGGSLTFLRDRVLFPQDDGLGEAPPPEDFFDRVNRLVASSPAGSRGVVFAPWLYGERAPVDDPTLRGIFFNLSVDTTRADMLRAVMEGVALNTRWILAPVERFCGRRLESLRVAGGGAQSDTWCQIYADVLDREILQVEAPIHATARGAAFLAMVGLGRMNFEDIPQRVPIRQRFAPDPQVRATYDGQFRAFVDLHSGTHAITRRLNRLRGS
jgi:xylulokinase